jgi:hypothetical protein
MMAATRRWVGRGALVVALAAAVGLGVFGWPGAAVRPAAAQTGVGPIGVGPFAKGAVVALRGTPHTWVADEWGTLHWAGDTRATANRDVSGSSRVEVALEQLRTLPRGEPWLSTAFVQLGDAIYHARWDTPATAPTLLRVASIADLRLFGAEGADYARVVLDRAAWEQKSGQNVDRLTRGDLPPTGAAAVDPWSQFTSAAGGFAVWAPGAAAPAAPGTASLLAGAASLAPDRDLSGVPSDLHVFLFGSYLDGPASLFGAASATLPDDALEQLRVLGPDALFDLARDEIAEQDGVRLAGYRAITQGTYRGREVTVEPQLPTGAPSVTVALRLVVVKDKLFVAAAATVPGAPTSPDVAKFLDSLTLLPG